jgi:hypothetical protein
MKVTWWYLYLAPGDCMGPLARAGLLLPFWTGRGWWNPLPFWLYTFPAGGPCPRPPENSFWFLKFLLLKLSPSALWLKFSPSSFRIPIIPVVVVLATIIPVVVIFFQDHAIHVLY